MIDVERYKQAWIKKLELLEENGPLPELSRIAFIHGYESAALFWHQQGLTEGWNDHIKKLAQLMEPLGGVGDL